MSDIQNTTFVTIASLLGSFFSYILQFFLGRYLSVPDYGTFNALLSVATVVGVPATVFATALIKKVSSLYAQKDSQKISALFWQSIIWSSALGFIIFGFFYLFKESIFGYLKISDSNLIISFSVYMALTLLWSVPYAYFQGLQKYKMFSFFVVMSNFLRLAIPVILLFTAKSVNNIFLGIIMGLCISILISIFMLKGDLEKTSDLTAWKELFFILKFSWPVMLASLCLISFNNTDMIFVRSNFTPEMAGYYAGVVTLGKILLFGSTPVTTVMYPKVSAAKANGGNIKAIFFQFLKMQAIVVGLGLLVFSVFPKLISWIFFGQKFVESVKYLPLYALVVALYVILNFLVFFLFAVDVTDTYWVLMCLAITQIALLTRFHSSIYQVLIVNMAVLLSGVILTHIKCLYYLKKS